MISMFSKCDVEKLVKSSGLNGKTFWKIIKIQITSTLNNEKRIEKSTTTISIVKGMNGKIFLSSTSQINEYKYSNVKHRTLIGKIFYDNIKWSASRCVATERHAKFTFTNASNRIFHRTFYVGIFSENILIIY